MRNARGTFVIGLLLIVVGVLALLDNLGVHLPSEFIWPLILIVLGLWLTMRGLGNPTRHDKE